MFLLACTGAAPPSTDDTAEDVEITGYAVDWTTDPDPLSAGSPGTMTLQVTDQAGNPVEDLQQNHERFVHTLFVASDWSDFQHVHHEDFHGDPTVDEVREATFNFDLSLPYSGRYFIMFGYAHRNLWLQTDAELNVAGSPAQLAAPDTAPTAEVEADGIVATLSWTAEPIAGYEAAWSVHLTDQGGAEVTDLVPYLGADGHCAMVNAATDWGSHTHAWFPDMDQMAPGMEMPHLYDGPDLPFAYTFAVGGNYKMWIQFARQSVPGKIHAVPFVFHVSG